MKNIAVRLMYDGTDYHGWQYQENGITVQQTVEEALSDLTGESIRVTGCSRTDSGVHALDFVMNFHTNSSIPADKFAYALNCRLKDGIAATKSWEERDDFNARFSAKGKSYVYKIWNVKIRNPFYDKYSWHFPYDLDIDKMKKATEYFVGTYDFSAFMAAGGSQKTTVRTVRECDLCENNGMIEITVTADAFLYNMVRIIVGTLTDVGLSKIEPEDITSIINSCDRKQSGVTAPPQGLFLKKVYY